MTAQELREKYLSFFESKGHKRIPSASLIPENDPTTLFTGSGMQPMIPYLLGEPHPEGTRITDAQKCFRTVDIDEAGDNRHTTFFEMLGNWSLGDYFKKEQISWIYEFLVKGVGLDPTRLYVTVFRGNDGIGVARDEESAKLWQEQFAQSGIEANVIDMSERDGMQGGRIFYYDDTKNWWSRSGGPQSMPEGEPGGPDSEMFWDFGEELGMHEASELRDQPCHVNCDCGRFLEIGNNVFMQYKKIDGRFEPLPENNVDFGGGLERIAAASINDPDVFRIDVFSKALKQLENLSGKTYGDRQEETYAFRVILDHLRAATFLIADGVLPSNKDQGYFTRRLIRRAVRFGTKLGIDGAFAEKIGTVFVEVYRDSYPELTTNQERIYSELMGEETKFRTTLAKGEREVEKIFGKKEKLSGEDAFLLYASFGFPLELTEEIAAEHGQNVDREIFEAEFKKHQDLSRTGAEQKFAGGLADHSEESKRLHTATHLLHQALRKVLGDHVAQKGSNITVERLRFDFSHDKKMTDEEKASVVEIVNDVIKKDLPVHFEVLSLAEAKARGAIGLFEDKYVQLGGKVKVYFVGDFSKEVCGGPHVDHTGELGSFKILKEEASSAGVRRIKAVLG
ncbi:TPA: alanine--tRNA ligase [Candidatus Uhrbacteria bacterium]|nr:alanine--tRNA ligase [Candidatus Uhrbacteria bacterium]